MIVKVYVNDTTGPKKEKKVIDTEIGLTNFEDGCKLIMAGGVFNKETVGEVSTLSFYPPWNIEKIVV